MKKGLKKIIAVVLVIAMAMTATVPAFAENNIALSNDDPWVYIGHGNRDVSWNEAATANDIADNIGWAVAGACLISPYWGATAILAAIGPTKVLRWVGRAGNGTIDLDWYQMVSMGTVQYKIEWTITVDGETYPCDTLYWVANPYYRLEEACV